MRAQGEHTEVPVPELPPSGAESVDWLVSR